MNQLKSLNSIFNVDLDGTTAQLEKIKQRLDSLIFSEDTGARAIQKLEQINSEVNQILSRANSTGIADFRAMEIKSEELNKAVNLLSQFHRQYREFYDEDLLEQIRLTFTEIEGFSLYYKMQSLVKQKVSSEELLKLFDLLTEFVENHWETNSAEVNRIAIHAYKLAELKQKNGEPSIEEWLTKRPFERVIELNYLSITKNFRVTEEMYIALVQAQEKFIESALLAQKKIEAKILEIKREEDHRLLPDGGTSSNLGIKLVTLGEDGTSDNQELDLPTITKEKAQAILDSIWVKIPESERAQKRQNLKNLLKRWQEEDINEQYNDTP